jgi:hypothetical protein
MVNITNIPQESSQTRINWLPLEQIASIEVVSETASRSIEDALLYGAAAGWRAALPGEQIIRLSFDTPQRLSRIWLLFVEREVERSQELVLRWSSDGGKTFQEIVRQQWNFSPRGSVQEVEDYHVQLSGVTHLELQIIPDRSGAAAHASIAQLRLA